MRRRSRRPVALLCSLGAILTTAMAPAAPGTGSRPAVEAKQGVLVELFTSQGCSSCPPADRLLSKLGARGDVVALAFHVDYWNYIGWTDPLSQSEWSGRQRSYAGKLGAGSIYTPQLVVDGRWQGVGSDRGEVIAALERAAALDRIELELVLSPSRGTSEGDVRLSLRFGWPPRLAATSLAAYVAITESGFRTPVQAGENARRVLENDHVVRRLLPPLVVKPDGGAVEATLDIALEPGWRRDQLTLVAYLQDPESLAIHGSAALDLEPTLLP